MNGSGAKEEEEEEGREGGGGGLIAAEEHNAARAAGGKAVPSVALSDGPSVKYKNKYLLEHWAKYNSRANSSGGNRRQQARGRKREPVLAAKLGS